MPAAFFQGAPPPPRPRRLSWEGPGLGAEGAMKNFKGERRRSPAREKFSMRGGDPAMDYRQRTCHWHLKGMDKKNE